MFSQAICRICLIDNIKMFSIRNTQLQEVCERLTNYKLFAGDEWPDTVCHACHSHLQLCRKYIETAKNAEKILSHILQNGLKFSQELVTSLNGGTPLNDGVHKNINYDSSSFENEELYSGAMGIGVKEEEPVKEESSDLIENDLIEIKIEVPVTKKSNRLKIPRKRQGHIKNARKNKKSVIRLDHKHNSDDKPFACDRCGKAFSQMGNLTRHKRLHTGGKPHVCDICNKTFAEKVYLKVHRRIHTGENMFACDKCDKTFVQKCNLQRHERTHTGEKPYACTHCHKTFSDMSQLKCHTRFHTQEKPYACDRCGLRFSNVSNFNSHMRTHTGEKPYSCNICYKTFPRSTTLKSHMLIHSTEKPYDCNKCNKKFNSSKYLKRHMRVHSGVKPYACDICDKTFTVKKSLKKHMSIHTGEKL